MVDEIYSVIIFQVVRLILSCLRIYRSCDITDMSLQFQQQMLGEGSYFSEMIKANTFLAKWWSYFGMSAKCFIYFTVSIVTSLSNIRWESKRDEERSFIILYWIFIRSHHHLCFFYVKDKKPSNLKKSRNQLLMEPIGSIGNENLQESDNS
ncbi:hypothetical protein RCL_jg1813.t1 [Rhizophagus clarus]|uniref:Uncharacterized protein n=1 Tax=Rhizophagus clarus TaxID=94130 RepID=A0A8H3LA68_9GLOM|nr:hypothetical protein RCL_jg1813.t1 [Rhizophagus clarus]